MRWVFPVSLRAALAVAILMSATNAEGAMARDEQSVQSVTLDQCLDRGTARMGMMRAIIACYTDELSRKDDVLNGAYRSVQSGLGSNKRQQLQTLERRWIAHRDRACHAGSNEAGGQDGIIIWYGCLIRETDKRIEWLRLRKLR